MPWRPACGGRAAVRWRACALGVIAAVVCTFAEPVAAHADAALAARVRDPVGWWKGRTLVEVDARASGGASGLRARLPELRALGVGAVVLAPMRLDAAGAVEDHAALDPRVGTADEWAGLVGAAHAADIAVIVAAELNDVARTHPWFVAAEAGDRLAQDSFVWADAPLAGRAERWSESTLGGRWYFHARGADRPDLDLRHRLTRARVERALAGWLERGADGLLLGSVRLLFEDDAGDRDRPDDVALVRDFARTLGEGGALVAVDVDASALLYLGASVLAIDGERSRALALPVVPGAVFAAGDRALPTSAALGARATDPRAAVRAILSQESPLVAEAVLGDAAVRAALAARRAQPPLRSGLRVPLGEPGPATWSLARAVGGARVVVVDNGGAAAAVVQLDARALAAGEVELAPLVGGVEATWRAGRIAASVPPHSTAAWLLRGGAPPTAWAFGRPGLSVLRAGTAIDRGLASADLQGIGFDRDVERTLSCERARGRDAGYLTCSVPLDDVGLRWHVELPPGPYDVEVEVLGKPHVTAEGQALATIARKHAVGGAVFVRDGRLTLDASGAGGALGEVRVRPARFRAESPEMDVRADRVVLRAPGPGVVEWRMNNSSAEPTESAPLVRNGAQWEATLGPWPKGAVNKIAWVIRSAEGTFVTAAGGAEVTVAIP